jgi:cellulose synthase/poly-beta-1,6-N-acetylglucosamine synthase-like glycosyltransferase
VGRRVTSQLGILRIVSGAMGAFRPEVLEQIGGWDIGPGLDGDITVKIRKARHLVYFEPRSICFTSVPRTFRALARQRVRWSRSLVRFRLRKHRDVYVPDQNFSLATFFSFAENVVYGLLLDIKWIVYIADMLVNFPVQSKYIIPANFLLYLLSNMIQLGVIVMVSERPRQEARLACYLPLVPLYNGMFLRVVRSYAYLAEWLFKSSYLDPWNPAKVSRQARQAGM